MQQIHAGLLLNRNSAFGMVKILAPEYGGRRSLGLRDIRYNRDTINFLVTFTAWQLSGIPVNFVNRRNLKAFGPKKYGSRYSHEKWTVVKAGYHSVELETYGIKAELTPQPRFGFSIDIPYPEGKESMFSLIWEPNGAKWHRKKGMPKQVGKHEIARYA